jgi:hypothetical protein
MVDENDGHAVCVAAWLEGAPEGLPAARLIDLFERAWDALWTRVRPTLGDVTIGAIVGRVVYTASEHYPPFAALELEPTGLRFDGLSARADELHHDDLFAALRFLLIEFLSVLGHLTAEVVTPALHTTLRAVTLEPPTGASRGKRRPKTEPKPRVTKGKKPRKP